MLFLRFVRVIAETPAAIWRRFQVELHGQYSLARLLGVHDYRQTSSALRAGAVCVLTPVPVVLLLMAIDAVPLSDPHDGPSANYVFWLRNWISVMLMTIGILEQFRNCLPRLPMPLTPLLTISVFATTIGVGQQIACALLIGFPLPFGLLVGTTLWTPAVIVGCYTQWNLLLRQDASLFRDLKEYLVAFSGQLSMTVVYPAYIYFFTSLEGTAQNLFVIVLAMIKVFLRNCMSRNLTNMDDLKPEVLIFNIEVFHALYVSCSLQTSTSFVTTVVVMFIDMAQAGLSLVDIHLAERKLARLLGKIPMDATASRAFLAISAELLNDPNVLNHPRLQSERYRSFLVVAAKQQQHHTGAPRSKYNTTIHLASGGDGGGVENLLQPTMDVKLSASALSPHGQLHVKTASVHGAAARRGSALALVVPFDTPVNEIVRRDGISVSSPSHGVDGNVAVAAENSELHHPGINVALTKALTLDERVDFVKYSTRALFLTEFLGLVEFTEVMMPIIYTMYLLGMSQLSNRQYYPRLSALSDDELNEMIGSVMTYAFLEFLSFIAMASVIYYKLRLSTLHQVAYALETHVTEIQSKMALWTLYVVQCMLFHSGVDFSMKFAWLSEGNT